MPIPNRSCKLARGRVVCNALFLYFAKNGTVIDLGLKGKFKTRCPACQEAISVEASKCRACGFDMISVRRARIKEEFLRYRTKGEKKKSNKNVQRVWNRLKNCVSALCVFACLKLHVW
jgi:hypothetical protein